MKRLLSLLLTIVVSLSMCLPVSAVEMSSKTASTTKGGKLIQYMQKPEGKLLLQQKNYGYMTFVDNFKSDVASLYLLQMTDMLINTGTSPDKEKYMDVLVNIIATYDMDCAEGVSEQYKMDNLKTLKDYAMDCATMGKDAVSVIVGNNAAVSGLETTISTAIDGMDVFMNNTEHWIEELSNLETVVQDYSEHYQFLELVEKKSEGDLKEAAQTLRQGMEKAMEIKLDTYKDISENNYEKYGEFFFSNVFFDIVKMMPEYEEDEALKYLIDSGDNILSKIGTLKSSWELGLMIGKLVGDVAVGGENLTNRVLEMMAIYDISEILQEETIETGTQFLKNVGNDIEVELAGRYVSLSQYLIGCRIRGEYCLYSIVAKDAGLLSWFNKKSAEEAKKWYEEKTFKILGIQDKLLQTCESSPALSEDELLAIVESMSEKQMERYIYVDMDHDGSKELIGVCLDDNGFYQAWYCSSDGEICSVVHQNDDVMDSCKIQVLELANETHVAINAYRAMGTGKNYTILALENKNIQNLLSNKYGYVSMNDKGDIILNVEAYDGMYDASIDSMILHTWKDTYLYFDGNEYKEYGATEISADEFSDYENAQIIKEAIDREMKKQNATSIEYSFFKRKNGIIHIQCDIHNGDDSIMYGYYTIRYKDKTLATELGDFTSGQISSHFSDLQVTY